MRTDRRNRGTRAALVVLLVGLVPAVPSRADDWPHRRGPEHNGHSRESSGWTGERWPLRHVWSAEVGKGASAPVVVGDRLYVMGWRDGRDLVQALDAGSGQPLWTASYEAPRYGRWAQGDQGLYAGPSSTPEFDPETGLLYTLGLDGQLNCWDTNDGGRRVWGLNLYDRFGVGRRPRVGRSGLRDYGYTSSPLVWRRWLIVEVGADSGNLIAFRKRTGELAWQSRNTDPAGHTAGPVPLSVEGVPCVAVLTHRGLLVARVDREHAGETVAEQAWETSFANNVVAPTVVGNRVLVTSAYNQDRTALFEVTLRGMREIWEQAVSSKVCSPVVTQGAVCWAWQKLRCLDLATGAPLWEGGAFGDAASLIVTADERLIVWGGSGRLVLVEGPRRSAARYVGLAVKDDLAKTDAWPHAALADRRLFLKDRDGNLRCMGIAPPEPPPSDPVSADPAASR